MPIRDKTFAAGEIQQLLDNVYKGGTNHLVDNSVFSPYSSGDHHYLIAKAYITFYDNNVRQQVWGILLDIDSGWSCSITEKELDYFVRTGDRTYLPQAPNLDPNSPSQTPYTEPSLTANSTRNYKNETWPNGRMLIHPEHFVQTYVINVRRYDTLTLRSGPGTRFTPLKQIPRNETDIIAFDQDQVWDGDTWWCPVEWQGFRGYVGRSYLPTTE